MCPRLATLSSLSSVFLFHLVQVAQGVSVWQHYHHFHHCFFSHGLGCARKYSSGNAQTTHPQMRTCHGKSCGGFFTTISSKYRLGFFNHPSVGHQYILSLLGSIVPNCEQCWEYTQPQSTLRDHLALPACQNTSQEVKLLSKKKFTHCGSDSCQEGSHENCLAQTLRLDNPFCRRSVRSDDIFGGPVNSITGSLIITDKRGSRSAKTDHLRFSTERATRVLHLLVLACECQWERHSRTNSWYSRPLRELTKHH